MSSNKNIKSYFLNILKEDRKRVKKHFNSIYYNKRILNFFVKNKKYHPISFFILLNKCLIQKRIKNTDLFLSEVTNDTLSINWNFLLKRDKSLIFEWFSYFQSLQINKNLIPRYNFSEMEIKQMKSDLLFYLPNFYENIKIDTTEINDDLYKTIFQAAIRFETIQRHLIYRIWFIIDLLKDKIKDVETLKKFYIILCWILYQKEFDSDCLLDKNKLLISLINFPMISNEDIIIFFQIIWEIKYENFRKKINWNWLDFYFPKDLKELKYNKFVNNIIQIHETPFLQIESENNNYIYDDSLLIKNFFSKFLEKFLIRDEKDTSNKNRFLIIEEYTKSFVENWLSYTEESKLNKDKYIVLNSVKFKGKAEWDIDLLIYNKESKNLIIFEIKDKIDINEELYEVLDIEELTKQTIPWRKEDKPWTIYKGIEQLINHSKRTNIGTKFSEWQVEIKNIQYVFLNHYNSFMWNEIIRKYTDKNQIDINLILDKYHFMSLYEFELFISIANRRGLDFYELLLEKSEYIPDNERICVIQEYTKPYDDINKKSQIHSNPKWINYGFEEFFSKSYNYKWYEWCVLAPFVKWIDFTSLFK